MSFVIPSQYRQLAIAALKTMQFAVQQHPGDNDAMRCARINYPLILDNCKRYKRFPFSSADTVSLYAAVDHYIQLQEASLDRLSEKDKEYQLSLAIPYANGFLQILDEAIVAEGIEPPRGMVWFPL